MEHKKTTDSDLSGELYNLNISGLSHNEVLSARAEFGSNVLPDNERNHVLEALKEVATEPMVIILLLASAIYFISGAYGDALFLVFAILVVSAISLIQDSRSKNALEKLKNLTQDKCKVIRNYQVEMINKEDLVHGDTIIVEEGTSIVADAIIIHSNDFSVDESILSGESLPVYKDKDQKDNFIYSGTNVTSGLAIAIVSGTGTETRLGQIGKNIESIKAEKTPLEKQIFNFVKSMVLIGVVVFLVVWGINFFRTYDLLDSLLKALTLAMSILPEEIPMAFTAFMALGAWRLMKSGIVVRQMKTIETLGSATVICTDKTGTITENQMSLALLCLPDGTTISSKMFAESKEAAALITAAMWASEPIPFDPMELALHSAYSHITAIDERSDFSMRHEYPLSGKPPMMTHIFENQNGKRIVAAKGAPEALMRVSHMSSEQKTQIITRINEIGAEGYRVLGVGLSSFEGDNFPQRQDELSFEFKGIVAFYDPPKENIREVMQAFYRAGIEVKIITGDSQHTTSAIARQIKFRGSDQTINGEELMLLSDTELKEKVKETNIFTRMFPQAKLRIIHALKSNGQVVAMTGDGVNDGPALKAAHIGIAMGKKGTEIAKHAASLVLSDDDLSRIVEAIAAGRKIYANLKKAIQYIISIHIPIILTVFLPLALSWKYPNIFSPVHVIFLELIMGPTCSIAFENEPMEKNTMLQKPRSFSSTFFKWKELSTSIMQGLAITTGTLIVYQLSVHNGYNEAITRSMVFTSLISANLFLTLVNRSFYYSIMTTMAYKNKLLIMIILISVLITLLLVYIPVFAAFFDFQPLSLSQISMPFVIGFLSVIWFEFVKLGKRIKNKKSDHSASSKIPATT